MTHAFAFLETHNAGDQVHLTSVISLSLSRLLTSTFIYSCVLSKMGPWRQVTPLENFTLAARVTRPFRQI